jgi:hypothetical protein
VGPAEAAPGARAAGKPACEHAPVTTAVRSPDLQASATPRKQWWQLLSPTVVGCVVAAAVAVWSTRGAWGGRPPAGEDVMGNLVRLDFGISHLVAHGRLDG